jgi:hypothetical protein
MIRGAPILVYLLLMAVLGCGPAAPRVLIDTPDGIARAWNNKLLYHTPNAYIYAENPYTAGETDRWVKEVRDYVKRRHHRDMAKGLVLVMEPADAQMAATLEDVVAMERDPAVMRIKPKRQKEASEIRERLRGNGVPESAMTRGSTVPLTPEKLRSLGVANPYIQWAVAAPSHALALECGLEVGAAAFRRHRPDIPEAKAREAAALMKSALAKGFEVTRGDATFILWAQQQTDWTYEQLKSAVLERLKHTCRAYGIPLPKVEDLEW